MSKFSHIIVKPAGTSWRVVRVLRDGEEIVEATFNVTSVKSFKAAEAAANSYAETIRG